MLSLVPESDEFEERPIEVLDDESRIRVRADGNDWISLFRDGQEVSREQSGGDETSFVVAPGHYVVRTNGRIRAVESEVREVPASATAAHLWLTSDAPDTHLVDGIGEIPADGESFCIIAVTRYTGGEQPTGDEEIFLRASGGLLTDDRGERVRSVRLTDGRASFRLNADKAPKLVTVYAFGEDPQLTTELRIEFV